MTSPITKMITAFRRHLKKQKKHPSTVQSYSNDATLFIDWLTQTIGKGFSVRSITSADIKDFKSYLLTRDVSATSVNRKLTALRQFFDFAITQNEIGQNPVAVVPSIPLAVHFPSVLTKKEQLLLLRTVDKSMRPLDSSIILLLLQTGLRGSEICALTVGDLHLTPRKAKIFIRGDQGKKLRFVNLTLRTQTALRQYCRRKGISILSRLRRDEPLLRQTNGIALTQQYIDHVVKRIGKQAGIAYVTPTMLRNTFAIQNLMNGEAPDKVERALGVGSVKTLQKMVESMKQQEE